MPRPQASRSRRTSSSIGQPTEVVSWAVGQVQPAALPSKDRIHESDKSFQVRIIAVRRSACSTRSTRLAACSTEPSPPIRAVGSRRPSACAAGRCTCSKRSKAPTIPTWPSANSLVEAVPSLAISPRRAPCCAAPSGSRGRTAATRRSCASGVRGLSRLANLYRVQGEYRRAESLYRRALALAVKELGEDDLTTAGYSIRSSDGCTSTMAGSRRQARLYRQPEQPQVRDSAPGLEGEDCITTSEAWSTPAAIMPAASRSPAARWQSVRECQANYAALLGASS